MENCSSQWIDAKRFSFKDGNHNCLESDTRQFNSTRQSTNNGTNRCAPHEPKQARRPPPVTARPTPHQITYFGSQLVVRMRAHVQPNTLK